MEGGGQGRRHGSAGRQAVVWGNGSGPQWVLPCSLPPWPLGRCLCSGPALQGGVLTACMAALVTPSCPQPL